MLSESILIGSAASAVGLRIENCTFTNGVIAPSVGASVSPLAGIYVNGSFAATSLFVDTCTFDGGTTGFDSGGILVAGALTNLRVYNCTFTNGADINAPSGSSFRGILSNNTMSASCRVINDRLKGYPLGLVSSSAGGNAILSNPNLYVTGDVYWVYSVAGSDSNPGTEEDHPLATLSQALTLHTAANGDLIIVKSGHTETLAAGLTITEADTKIFGTGASSTSKPTFGNSAASILLTANTTGVEFHGLRFTAPSVSATHISVTGNNCVVEGCDFICGANSATGLNINAGDSAEVDNCTFTVTAVGPVRGIQYAHTNQRYNRTTNCTFDGGSSVLGWTGGAIKTNSATQREVFYGNTFRNGADIIIPTGETSIVVSGNTMDATSRVDWTI